ncbi:MAG: LCP family protein [Candidatus Doudnabacteria bacterium]
MSGKPPVIKSSSRPRKIEPEQNPYKPTKLTRPTPASQELPESLTSESPTSIGQELNQRKLSRSKKAFKIIVIGLGVVMLGLGIFIFARANDLFNKIFVGNNNSFYSKITDLISSQTGHKLIGEKDNQINILLLGIGGPGHDGPYLSDTIIVAQIKPKDNKATLVSIPRDYLVNTKKLGQRKINATFAETFEETKNWEEAGQATIDVVEEISGLQIPYFAVIDFDGFEKTIDLLGGVEVSIDNTFTDYSFPNNSNGYIPPVTFTEGSETMDGERALIFARSRHAAGIEGTDFARGLRQQKVLHAMKEKVVSLNLVADAGKINEIFSIIGEHFHTNLTPGELIRLYSIGKDYNKENIASLSLDPDTGLICPETLESNGAFVLTICAGKTKDDVKDFFSQSFDTAAIQSEKATVWLADSSVTQKLYKSAETTLTNNGFTVYKVIYSGDNIGQNVVYQVNQKPATLDFVKQKLDASEVSIAPPGIKIDPEKVDVIVILGD